MNKEILGLRLEVSGLAILLIATVWQLNFTDWYDKAGPHAVAYNQETVNIGILTGMKALSQEIVASDSTKRAELQDKVRLITDKALQQAIAGREAWQNVENGEARALKAVRSSLALLGAILLVFGKWMICRHKTECVQATSRMGT